MTVKAFLVLLLCAGFVSAGYYGTDNAQLDGNVTANSFFGNLFGDWNGSFSLWGNISAAMANITALQANESALWSNTSNQDGRIDILEAAGPYLPTAGGTLSGSLVVNGNVSVFGNYVNFNVSNADVNGSILPTFHNVFFLGAADKQWDGRFINSLNASAIAYGMVPNTAVDWTQVPTYETDAAHDTCAEVTGCVQNAIIDGNTGWDNTYGYISTVTENTTYLALNFFNKTGTLTNTKVCTYNSVIGTIDCNSDPSNYDDAPLWTNASNQDGRIIALESGGSATAANGNITLIWGNVTYIITNITALQANVSGLWTNASNQDGRIVLLEARPVQPTIDAANITSGVLVNARYNMTLLVNYSNAACIALTGSADLCDSSDATGAGALQPTIDASNITSGTLLNVRYNMTYLSDVANATGQESRLTILDDNVTDLMNISQYYGTVIWLPVASSQNGTQMCDARDGKVNGWNYTCLTVVDWLGGVTSCDANSGSSAQVAACKVEYSGLGYYLYDINVTTDDLVVLRLNDSGQQAHLTTLYGNASNQDGRILSLEGRAVQPLIDASNVTSGIFNVALMPVGWLNKTYADTLYQASGVALQPNIAGANVTSGTIGWQYLPQQILNTSTCATDQYYLYGSGCVAKVTGSAAQPSIDASNITAGTIANARYNSTYFDASYVNEGVLPAQPNIDGANVTSGTVADARIDSAITRDLEVPGLETDSAHDQCSEITGCVENAVTAVKPNIDAANITGGVIGWQYLPQTTLNTTTCTSGQFYLYGSGCTVAPTAYDDSALWSNASNQDIRLSATESALLLNQTAWKDNDTGQQTHITNLWANASTQSGILASLITNTSDQQTHITNLWTNASTQSAQQVALWGNASNQDTRVISLEGRALKPSIDTANITSASVGLNLGSKDLSTTGNVNATIFRMGTFCIRWLNATHVTQEPVCGV